MSQTVVYQSEGRGPVLAQGGLFTELKDEGEITNCLWAFNNDLRGPDGQVMRDECAPYEYNGQTFTSRPRPVWLTKPRFDDLIGQSQQAVRGGNA